MREKFATVIGSYFNVVGLMFKMESSCEENVVILGIF